MALNLLLSLTVTIHARFSIVDMPKLSREWAIADATNWFYGWREMGEEILKHPEIAYTITPSHQITPELIYYTREKVFSYIDIKSTRPSQFNLWSFPDLLKDRPAWYVDVVESEPLSESYKDVFVSTGTTRYLTVRRWDFPIRVYRIVEGRGYKQ